MSDPWLPPAQQHPAAPQPAAGFGFPPAPVAAPPRATSGIAVAALVVAVVALIGVIGLTLAYVGSAFGPGLAGAMGDGYELEGTLPQAAPGRVYTPQEVQAEVERVLEADWSTFEDLECERLTFEPGASTSCTGIVDDLETEIEMDVVDDAGHFTLTQYW